MENENLLNPSEKILEDLKSEIQKYSLKIKDVQKVIYDNAVSIANLTIENERIKSELKVYFNDDGIKIVKSNDEKQVIMNKLAENNNKINDIKLNNKNSKIELANLIKEGRALIDKKLPDYIELSKKDLLLELKNAKNPKEVYSIKKKIYLINKEKYNLLELLTNNQLDFIDRKLCYFNSLKYRITSYFDRKKYEKYYIENTDIISDEQKTNLLAPIYAKVKPNKDRIEALRADGDDKIAIIESEIRKIKKNRELNKVVKKKLLLKDKEDLKLANVVSKLQDKEIKTLTLNSENTINELYNTEYLNLLKLNRKKLISKEKERFENNLKEVNELNKKELVDALTVEANTPNEIKERKEKISYTKLVNKNRLIEIKFNHKKNLAKFKDDVHQVFLYKYHMIDLLRNSMFTFSQKQAQKFENFTYSFKFSTFFLKYGLYFAIIFIFIALGIVSPLIGRPNFFNLSTMYNILAQSAPRMFLALGVAGCILIGGTDLSVGRMVGLAGVVTAMLFHKGDNAIQLFGNTINFDALGIPVKIFLAIFISILLCSLFSTLAGFFTAKFKIHPFVTTLATQLTIFGFLTYTTGGLPSGGIDMKIKNMLAPTTSSGFPTIILWGLAIILIMWFIWNKTKFGKYMYAVGGNKEAASVSGISVFAVTLGVFIMAGVLYALGGFLECLRLNGSMSSTYGTGWEGDAIAAAVVGGISFSGGIGKISGIVVGVIVFQALQVALTTMNIDANLIFVFKGLIILAAVTIDSLKYMKKK